MKKVILIAVLALVPLSFAGCDSGDTNTDTSGLTIESRIAALEAAINAHSWEDYLACFASSSSYQDSFTESQFSSIFGDSEPYTTYHFGAVAVDGTAATCTSTKSTSGDYVYANVFTMVKEGEAWYIERWEEDTTVVWQVPGRE